MIALRGVTKRFGTSEAVADFSLTIEAGAFCVLVGPSGCGKSTVLRMINALITPDAGTIEVNGMDLRTTSPVELRRKIGYVIQSVGLFPHWTIADNILAVPRLLDWPKKKSLARLDEISGLLGIERHLLDRYPRDLSGGQQQRAGVARALAADPQIVLMDEPFAALDPLSRTGLQQEIRRIHKASAKTIVFVTHDMDEALRLATTIAVMRQGRIVQSGAPADIVLDPADGFVRAFFAGPDSAYRVLDAITVAKRMRDEPHATGPAIAASASLKEALSLMLNEHARDLRVDDDRGVPIGAISIDDIVGKP